MLNRCKWLFPAEAFEALIGLGAKGKVNGRVLFVGAERLFLEQNVQIVSIQPLISPLEKQGKTVILLGDEKEVIGVIAIGDRLRAETKDAIQKLKQIGIEQMVMLTGDNEGTAKAIARETGVDKYFARLLPDDKVKKVKELRRQSTGIP